MCFRQLFILLVLPLATFFGCGEGRGHGEPNHHAHDGSTDNHGHSHDDQDDIPHPYKGKANPNLSQHKEGRTLWLQHCSSCHGEGGAGDGPVSQGHDPAPTNFTVSGVASMRDDYLLWRISEGGDDSSMPAYKETLEEEEIWKVVDFLRSLEQDG